jgi:hypothetical protein
MLYEGDFPMGLRLMSPSRPQRAAWERSASGTAFPLGGMTIKELLCESRP